VSIEHLNLSCLGDYTANRAGGDAIGRRYMRSRPSAIPDFSKIFSELPAACFRTHPTRLRPSSPHCRGDRGAKLGAGSSRPPRLGPPSKPSAAIRGGRYRKFEFSSLHQSVSKFCPCSFFKATAMRFRCDPSEGGRAAAGSCWPDVANQRALRDHRLRAEWPVRAPNLPRLQFSPVPLKNSNPDILMM
jgi:hypothetical protein